jgi:MFS family permease
MCTETAIVYNMDAYSASIPLWFQQKAQLLSLGLVMGVAILSTMIGGYVAGSLLDRWGTRKVQGASLILMLLTGVGTSFAQNWAEMMFQYSVRDFACAVGIVTCGMRVRSLLPSNDTEQLK